MTKPPPGVLAMRTGVRGQPHQPVLEAGAGAMVWSTCWMLGSGATALNKVGEVSVPWELPFILVMEAENGEAS